MKTIHAWDVPELRVLEIDRQLAIKIGKGIDDQKTLINKLSTELNYKKDTIRKFLQKIKKGKAWIGTSIPFQVLLEVCKIIDVTPSHIEQSLISIKTLHMKCKIINCKFPVRIDPIFVSFLFHHYGDGCGRYWSQKISRTVNREKYFQKAEHIIGEIKNWGTKTKKDIRTPSIFLKLFDVAFNLSYKDIVNKKIPRNIPMKTDFLMAALVSIIIDDGCVNSNSISITQKDRRFLSVLRNYCIQLVGNRNVSKIRKMYVKYKDSRRESYRFSILACGILPFHKRLKSLINNYGEILNLADKMDKFNFLVEKYQKKLDKANSVLMRPSDALSPQMLKILVLISEGFNTSRELINFSVVKKSMTKEILKRSRESGLTRVNLGPDASYIYTLSDFGKIIVSLYRKTRSKSELHKILRKPVTKRIILSLLTVKDHSRKMEILQKVGIQNYSYYEKFDVLEEAKIIKFDKRIQNKKFYLVDKNSNILKLFNALNSFKSR